MKKTICFLLLISMISGCATSRDLSSPHYLPDWENRFFTFPAPTESSAGYWAVKTARATGQGLTYVVLTPLALAGNLVMNAYYIVTWPFRWSLRGDKRLIVWYPLFSKGEAAGSPQFSKEWNEDLS